MRRNLSRELRRSSQRAGGGGGGGRGPGSPGEAGLRQGGPEVMPRSQRAGDTALTTGFGNMVRPGQKWGKPR